MEPSKHTIIMIGTYPAEKLFHRISFKTKNTRATKKLKEPIINPNSVAIRKPILV